MTPDALAKLQPKNETAAEIASSLARVDAAARDIQKTLADAKTKRDAALLDTAGGVAEAQANLVDLQEDALTLGRLQELLGDRLRQARRIEQRDALLRRRDHVATKAANADKLMLTEYARQARQLAATLALIHEAHAARDAFNSEVVHLAVDDVAVIPAGAFAVRHTVALHGGLPAHAYLPGVAVAPTIDGGDSAKPFWPILG